MKTLFKPLVLLTAAAAIAAAPLLAPAQMSCTAMHSSPAPAAAKKPLPSPPAIAETTLDGKKIAIHYNTPHMRGRTIMGGLVPYGKVWRTGANPATSFVTEANLKVGDLDVPAGAYTLYTLPAAPGTPWLLILNKQTGQWGTVYNQPQDLGRTPMKYRAMSAPQEVMSISFEHTTAKHTQLHIRWETTDVWVPVTLQ
jgi:hypothetical protein